MITETMYGEVTGIERTQSYLSGYGKPVTVYTKLKIKFGDNDTSLRAAWVTVPADLPIGTRFRLTLEQVDEVTAATIHRGVIPQLEEAIEGKVAGELPASSGD